jgi:sulfhydrogenase subunit beta (sulfur reductase)
MMIPDFHPSDDIEAPNQPPPSVLIDRIGLQELISTLGARGFKVIGPMVRQDAIVYDEITGVDDLPEGWTDFQDGGTYRLSRRDDDALFGYAVGPHSWKRYLFPARSLLWRGRRTDDGFDVEVPTEEPPPDYAFLGVRGCELAAISVQDRVFGYGNGGDPIYASNREGAFIVAVNCTSPAGTCFCVSMGTGPRAGPGYDLALTEIIDGQHHSFLVEVGSERGADLIGEVDHRPARREDEAAAAELMERSAGLMGREMDTTGIKDLLYENNEHPRWQEVADRCLACGNCTMACPTCFCHTVEDTTDLTGATAERWRTWDSCFTLDFTYMGGGSVRSSVRSRYRQWLTHKLATWIDQFGSSGCVGCGRCIAWCPVGIDLTEEIRAMREPAHA